MQGLARRRGDALCVSKKRDGPEIVWTAGACTGTAVSGGRGDCVARSDDGGPPRGWLRCLESAETPGRGGTRSWATVVATTPLPRRRPWRTAPAAVPWSISSSRASFLRFPGRGEVSEGRGSGCKHQFEEQTSNSIELHRFQIKPKMNTVVSTTCSTKCLTEI